MKLFELAELINKVIAEKGFGGQEVTIDSGLFGVKDIAYCTDCKQFHIVTERIYGEGKKSE